MNKKIANIVFYQYAENGIKNKKACIFYNDGTVSDVSFDEGIDACEIIVKERQIKSKDAFREMINNDLVHVVSGEEFERNYQSYFPRANDVEDTLNRSTNNIIATEIPTEEETDEELENENNEAEEEIEDENENERTNTTNNAVVVPLTAPVAAADNNDTTEDDENNEEDNEDENEDEDIEEVGLVDNAAADEIDPEGEDLDNEIEEERPKGFFGRAWDKIKKSKLVKGILICGTALAVALGLYSCHQRKTKEGEMANSNLTTMSDNSNKETEKALETELNANSLYKGSNDYYDNYTFDQLLEVTTSDVQKRTMQNLDTAMQQFNGDFADAWVEEGKDVRAALTFDEIIALQVAYNDYEKHDLHAIFNGAELKSEQMSRNYKDATLQLMGAHVIESSEHPVDMSVLIESQEGKDFYKKYHEAFLAAKEATGQDQIDKVNAFYTMVRSDFTVDPNKRMEGISHAEVYDIESYKLSVTPMIAASEMMFQNLKTDVTLDDLEVQFFNQLGLCNLADGAFGRAEIVTMACCQEDDTNPLYEQYRKAIIEKYTALGIYYIDDAHRELTKLDRFQQIVNGNKDFRAGGWSYNTWVTESTSTRTEVNTWSETNTTYHEEETRTEKPIPDDVKKKIDDEIEKENQKAKEEAEKKAEEERERMQREEDEHAKKVEEEVKKDEEDMQDKIEDANDQIDKNNDDDPTNDKPVNESDFGDHNVDFDDDHSDENGNLDDSVENITTDPTGDQTNEPLPDPNETGKKFDEAAPAAQEEHHEEQHIEEYEEPVVEEHHEEQHIEEYEEPVVEEHHEEEHHEEHHEEPAPEVHEEHHEEQNIEVHEEPAEEHHENNDSAWVESVPVDDDTYFEDAWVEEDSSASKSHYTYEELVDAYVEQMAANSEAVYEFGYQYTK